jgi:hypothetical protein
MVRSTETVSHTPGPWMPAKGPGLLVIVSQDESIATIATGTFKGELPTDQILANARLIAAAPELLEALEPFAKFACGCGECHNCRALAAVNKARGA